ncbi:MAG TPA: DUF2173 family protein [Candidatus Competibacteraceae bacterium]|nr:DUF2173 family protein [Candidatus Competibacteraceae bacterium]
MSIVTELLLKPGVIAAGEYAYRGDRFSYRGALSEEQARMASILCRATTMGLAMEGDMLGYFGRNLGILPVRGWILRGPRSSLCVMANVFCLLDNRQGSLDTIVAYLRQALAGEAMDLI